LRTTGPTAVTFVFANPTTSLTVNGGDADDTITVAGDFDTGTAAGQFYAALTIDGQAGSDTITVDPALTLPALTLTAAAIDLNGGAVSMTGNQAYNGAVTLGAAGNATTLTGTDISFASTVRSAVDGQQALTVSGSGITT